MRYSTYVRSIKSRRLRQAHLGTKHGAGSEYTKDLCPIENGGRTTRFRVTLHTDERPFVGQRFLAGLGYLL